VLLRHFPWVRDHEHTIGLVFSAYTARKRARRLLDFDDLLLYWRAATTDPAIGKVLAEGYEHVLVDEYQDTNLLQADIVASLAAAGCAITAVGDDAQAIYAFRAASGRNMIDFPARFPGTTIVPLEQNYRSTQPILDLANFVLAGAAEGYDKRLWTTTAGGGRPILATCPDEGAQAEAVGDLILGHYEAGTPLRQQAVLFRSAHHSDLLELELHRRGIPFLKYGGLRFLEAAHVRDLVALLRVLDNAHDELAWYRILQLLEGVGPARARRCMSDLGLPAGAGGAGKAPARQLSPAGQLSSPGQLPPAEPALDPLRRFVAGGWAVPPRAAEDASALATALRDCSSAGLSPAAQVDRLRQALDPVLRRRYDNAEVRLRDFDALARVATGFHDRAGLVADLTLDPPSSTGDLAGPPLLDDDYVILSTVHSAKGGEWRVVHLIHAADGMFPSDLATGNQEDIEEERRLFYVAVTRAQQSLHVYAPLRYHHSGPFGRGDAHSYAQRTRFLPPAANGLLEHRPVRARPADSGPAVAIADLSTSVDASLTSLW
ncbi:MAG TPA: ATP-dependent helicase, partial [Acidimicrobiales bacterium]|nr:ATP-dependent helicase [Acidimicrobiales bacterium]